MSYQPIENHGVIGDLRTVALVGMDGSIDFMCFPDFDSPTIFASLLDHQKGGCFQIAPVLNRVRHKQLYLPDSNVLLTRFLSNDGVAEISDLMTIGGTLPGRNLLRRVKAVRGHLRFRMRCAPRFDYARASHEVLVHDHAILFQARQPSPLALSLRATVPIKACDGDACADFELREGQTASFLLHQTHSLNPAPPLNETVLAAAFKETLNFWHHWIAQSKYRGRWREMVDRSALLLKLLTSAQHGSMVAAPTFGFPEQIGGERNWDYRFTWIRDSAFTLYALMRLGFTDEAQAFFRWLDRVCWETGPTGPLQVMYGLDGHHNLDEITLDHLEGYRGSKPVRVGNAAWRQLQLDIYGELLDAVYLYDKYGRPITYDSWTRIAQILDWVCEHWHLPDEGIWEIRGQRQEFLFSRLMCWVALDRGIRLAMKRSLPGPLDRWNRVRTEIHHDIHTHFWNPKLQAFVQHKGSETVDAASLLMPLLKFIQPNDSRWFFTLRRIEQILVQDSLVFRYDTQEAAHDGLRGHEGTFSMCSFWYVECIARSGDIQKARFLFEKALGYANHLGLYAEELGPRGEHLGNFPQAFTHLALISAAHYLDQHLSDVE
jgi:GH15 family glucan-1,4-alpha-glucosidase